MEKVFLDELPRYNGKNKYINWKASIGYFVKFIYSDIKGEVEILDYKFKGQYLYIKYLDKKPFKISTSNFQQCKLSKLLGIITNEFRIEIGTKFKDNNRDLTIIDRKYIKDKNKRKRRWYKYRCNKCGFECGEHYRKGKYEKELWIEESDLLNLKQGCSCCHGLVVIPGINDIPTTAPWMIPYFQGGYDEAKKYTKVNGQKIYPICPDCGKSKDKLIKISNIYNNHSIGCQYCSDGKSYPEKFLINLLKQLNINFKAEYFPKWCKFNFKNKTRTGRYDFYFELNNKKYIIEMDGRFHKEDNEVSGQTREESKAIDAKKDKLAKEHNIKVIRVDCKKSELEYIKNSILKSKLNIIFDLFNINWNKIEEFALSNLTKKACIYKKDNPNMTTRDIGNIMNLNMNTIARYLKKGNKLGWCNYNPKEEQLKSNSKSGKKKGKPVEIFKSGVSLGEFKSVAELERQSEKLFGVKLINSGISLVCLGKQTNHKGFNFKYL